MKSSTIAAAALVTLILVLLYHTGVSAEHQCITKGNSPEACATLRL